MVLSSAWSAGNAFFYSSTRVLYASALDGKAPKILTFERFGVPYACVVLTTALGMLAYLNVANTSSEVFFWFSNISAVSTLIVWCSINITYVRFYYGLRKNGISRSSLPWKVSILLGVSYICGFEINFGAGTISAFPGLFRYMLLQHCRLFQRLRLFFPGELQREDISAAIYRYSDILWPFPGLQNCQEDQSCEVERNGPVER